MTQTPHKKPTAPDQDQLQKKQRQLKSLSHILDDAFTIPVLNIKIGWDAIIGLIPVVGDIIGALLSLYLVVQAAQLRLGAFTILRMLINIGIELLLGIVPVLGDFFDVTWRANRKNYELIDRHLAKKLRPPAGKKPMARSGQQAGQETPASQGTGTRRLFQFILGLLCVAAIYYFVVQWQAGNVVIPGQYFPAELLQPR
ncbi:MAG: DUF4112 domain-containing protein [Ketobacteraceae bacterium]|nr:DUF4112 domain-containing protein [Ketobacteraceae bacterium]